MSSNSNESLEVIGREDVEDPNNTDMNAGDAATEDKEIKENTENKSVPIEATASAKRDDSDIPPLEVLSPPRSEPVPPVIQPQPQIIATRPTVTPARPAATLEEEDDDDDDEDDDIDETLVERLVGLTEMLPQFITSGSVSLAKGSWALSLASFGLAKAATWVIFSTATIMFMPVMIETERLQLQDQQKAQKNQILLGPGTAQSGGPSLGPPPI